MDIIRAGFMNNEGFKIGARQQAAHGQTPVKEKLPFKVKTKKKHKKHIQVQ